MKDNRLYKFQIGLLVIAIILIIGAITGIFPQEILEYQISLFMLIK